MFGIDLESTEKSQFQNSVLKLSEDHGRILFKSCRIQLRTFHCSAKILFCSRWLMFNSDFLPRMCSIVLLSGFCFSKFVFLLFKNLLHLFKQENISVLNKYTEVNHNNMFSLLLILFYTMQILLRIVNFILT